MRGGLRTRLLMDSVRVTLLAGLGDLGWFDPTIHDTPPGARRHLPLRYITRPVTWDDLIEPNAFTVNPEATGDEPLGLGGDVEDQHRIYIDLFAENEQIGWHIARDLQDIALGNLPAIGRTGPVFDIYDMRQATPAPFTTVDVDRVLIDRSGASREWQRHWYMIRIDLADEYLDEADLADTVVGWSIELESAWQRIKAA